MPRIEAPTVVEHRALVRTRLIDAAEDFLRQHPSQPLSAGAVSAAAGIARNSIYRYVDSVEELRGLVVDRYLPDWLAAVAVAMAQAQSPEQQVEAWVAANLAQASETGHGWLMEAARPQVAAPPIDRTVAAAHSGMRDTLAVAWAELIGDDPDRVSIAVALTVGILEAGFRSVDLGLRGELVVQMGATAARALTTALVE
jgi:AcrR family transcriptional regulator